MYTIETSVIWSVFASTAISGIGTGLPNRIGNGQRGDCTLVVFFSWVVISSFPLKTYIYYHPNISFLNYGQNNHSMDYPVNRDGFSKLIFSTPHNVNMSERLK